MNTDLLQQIQAPIADALGRFNSMFQAALQHENPLLDTALRHILEGRGKQMRPMLTLLAAQAEGQVNPVVLNVAMALELLHTATLLHDDVVDESDERRGHPSINHLMGNQVAVLVGDFVLSKGLQYAAATQSPRVFSAVAELGQTLADGELFELHNVDECVMDEGAYFEVNRRKTASLFATCAQLGSLMAGASEEAAERMRRFGQLVGMCFQLRDDIFDLTAPELLGKPVGNDMREGKLTLPALYALHHTDNQEMQQVARRVRSRQASQAEIEALTRFTLQNGGIEYAQWQMDQFRMMAVGLINDSRSPQVAQALRAYVDFVVEREN